jgi:c(7)-type cytochrome triheme protein
MKRLQWAALAGLVLAAGSVHAQRLPLPPLPPPDRFGNLLISRTSFAARVKPATFSHWRHRLKYTCRVCHLELEFATRVNATEITEAANRQGQFCGACHDGTTAFGHTKENCDRCHNGDLDAGKAAFSQLKGLAKARFGNGVDWSAALASGQIRPATRLRDTAEPMALDTTLTLEAEFGGIPPAVFPHGAHVRWLDCANCHPGVFNIQKKTTKHFSMSAILKRQFCGECHLTVAFPLDDCKRCHPAMRR